MNTRNFNKSVAPELESHRNNATITMTMSCFPNYSEWVLIAHMRLSVFLQILLAVHFCQSVHSLNLREKPASKC